MSARARVQLVVEVVVDSSWGDDCTVGQVKKQATHDAKKKIGQMISNSKDVRLVNSPECLEIVYTEVEGRK